MKTWLSRTEWISYSACQQDSRFIVPPERLSEEDRDGVEFTCHRCPVRAECIAQVVENSDSGIWAAGVFVPEVAITDSPRRARCVLEQAQEIREHLAKTIPDELARRGDF